jgi:NAD(P)H-dependent FMN reductase
LAAKLVIGSMNQVKDIPGNTYEIVDLKDVDLPLLDEPEPASSGNYTVTHTKQWSELIKKGDAYVWVTPEYNHSTSPALLDAIDYLFNEWSYKPVAFVGYGGMGGTRAIHSLVPVAAELRMVPLRDRVHILDPWTSVSEDGAVDPSFVRGKPENVIAELVKVTEPLKPLRPQI